ncbi:MAG: hypothetical protein ACXWIN_10025, partial [Burkholderiaceae bacterium]
LAVNKIFEFARNANYELVVGRYIPTAKNMMVKNFFEQFGFHRAGTFGDAGTEWHLKPEQYVPRNVFIDEASTLKTSAELSLP